MTSVRLQQQFASAILAQHAAHGDETLTVQREAWREVMRFLRDEPELDYKFLSSVTGVDLGLEVDPRFEIVYHLYSISQRHRLRLKVQVNEDESVPTVTSLWKAADWYERETYDLFGIEFDGHPDLRRIMMPDDYEGHPLRKDFPLRGYTR